MQISTNYFLSWSSVVFAILISTGCQIAWSLLSQAGLSAPVCFVLTIHWQLCQLQWLSFVQILTALVNKCLYCLELAMELSINSQKCCLSTSYQPSGSEKWKWKSLGRVRLFVTSWIVHGILQARILELVAFPFSRGIFPTQELNPGLSYCRRILY